jgi:hypothetical protein
MNDRPVREDMRRVVNMPIDFATTRGACITQALLDGPTEHSAYDSIIEESVYELMELAPPSVQARAGESGACHEPLRLTA